MTISDPIYGLIGKKLGHSFSQKYFTDKFAREGISSRYELFEIPHISDFPHLWVDNPNLVGLNVTIPYKQEVIPFLDQLAPEAQAIQAVNTIRRSNDKLIGFNSDIFGFWTTLKAFLGGIQPQGALILGTGGAARAVAYVLETFAHIPDIRWVSRNPQKDKHISYKDLDSLDLDAFPLIVNTTPLGMYPDVDSYPSLPYERLGSHHLRL